MEEENFETFVADLKHHLRENDGEIVYWGEQIQIASPLRERSDREAGRERETPGSPGAHPFVPSLKGGEKAPSLEILRKNSIGDCHLCPLGDTRIKLVFGTGNPETDVMFVGEGPGYDEDRKGEPFVGKAGQLLDKIMGAIGLDRTKVYIANIVKCHPMVDASQPEKRGNDRPPAPEEIEKCRPFLIEQIKIIQPKIIVTLGGTATKALLRTNQGITAARGKLFDLSVDESTPPIKVLPTFHPAALLRDETLKKPVWEDMKLLRNLLEK